MAAVTDSWKKRPPAP